MKVSRTVITLVACSGLLLSEEEERTVYADCADGCEADIPRRRRNVSQGMPKRNPGHRRRLIELIYRQKFGEQYR